MPRNKGERGCDVCPEFIWFDGFDQCAEYDGLTALVVAMFGSWIVNVFIVFSVWMLSEQRQELGNTAQGPDQSAARHADTLLNANHWLCTMLGVLAGCYFVQFILYAYSGETYPNTVYGFLNQHDEQTDDYDPAKEDIMVQKRWIALLSACVAAAVVIFDWIGRKRAASAQGRSTTYTKYLLAGTVLAVYMATVAFTQIYFAAAEVKFGETVYYPTNGIPYFSITAQECAALPAKRALDTKICSYNRTAWGELGRNISNPAFEAAMRLGSAAKPSWGKYCQVGWEAYTRAYTQFNETIPPTPGSAAAAAWANVSASAEQCEATNHFTVNPQYKDYSNVEKGINMWALVMAIVALAVSIMLTIVTLALSEAQEDTHHVIKRETWAQGLVSTTSRASHSGYEDDDDQVGAGIVGALAIVAREMEQDPEQDPEQGVPFPGSDQAATNSAAVKSIV